MRNITSGILGLFVTLFASGALAQQEAPTGKAPKVSTQFRCVAQSMSKHRLPPPPPNPTTKAALDKALPKLCPSEQIPQPLSRHAPKGRLMMPTQKHFKTSQLSQSSYFYSAGYQYYNSIGTVASLTQHSPYLALSDSHTLAEIAVQSSDLRQIVEIGWTVDRGLNSGSSQPYLFTYHWVNGNTTCYNGCGYVQVSKTRYPGMPVTVTTTPQQYGIQYYGGNWWIWYQSEWIGYFPGSLWGGIFTSAGLTQWFGEVAASSTKSCTDMGNGKFGAQSDAAGISGIRFINGLSATPSLNNPQPAYYTSKKMNTSGSSFNYGGPGGC